MAKQHSGGCFDDFLEQKGQLEGANLVAVKRVIAWQIEQAMKKDNLTKTELAARMRTSRAALNRLLDEKDTSLTLTTLAGVAKALGKELRVELVDNQHC